MLKRCIVFGLCLLLCLTCPAPGEEAGARLEFEDGELLGGAVANGGWVEGLKRGGDGVQLTFDAPEDGEYEISILSASQSGRMQNDVLLDGERIATLVSEGGDFTAQTFSNVYMAKGGHTLSVMRNYGWIRLDAAVISRTPTLNPGVYNVAPALSNPNASGEARALMQWLCENYGVNMISGQYLDEGRYGREISAIGEATGGLYPALLGLDMMNYSPASVKLCSWPTSVDQAIEYWKQGHLITFCWHWVAPEKYLDTTGNNWWGGFYTQNTTFDLKKAMNGEDPEGYELLLRDMDAIAQQLTRLKDAGVPVIWRPLHEASGGWFWWGAGGRDAYKQLYRLMYDKFTNEYGLNNLIWLWNGQNALWYPGDDVVDIIGEDLYPGNHIHSSQAQAFAKCLGYTKERKLVMLSECGCVPDPAACAQDGTLWSAWATWCYEFVLDGNAYSEQYTSAEKLREFYSAENVITLKDVPAFGREQTSAQASSEDAEEARAEFEDGALSGAVSLGALGADKWVELKSNDENDAVTVRLSVPEDGVYDLVVYAAGIGGYKENYLYVDGEQLGNTVVSGVNWEECVTEGVALAAGEHEIKISCFWGWCKLDWVKAVKAE